MHGPVCLYNKRCFGNINARRLINITVGALTLNFQTLTQLSTHSAAVRQSFLQIISLAFFLKGKTIWKNLPCLELRCSQAKHSLEFEFHNDKSILSTSLPSQMLLFSSSAARGAVCVHPGVMRWKGPAGSIFTPYVCEEQHWSICARQIFFFFLGTEPIENYCFVSVLFNSGQLQIYI